MRATPYLNFDGTCAEAFRHYERVLGGTILYLQTHGDSPMRNNVGPEWHDRVMHALFQAGELQLMASDAPPSHYEKPSGVYVSLHLDSAAEADRIYAELSEGGEVKMPLQETFWAERFAMFSDRFGTPWMINCEGKARPA